jgi:hypothetical protein
MSLHHLLSTALAALIVPAWITVSAQSAQGGRTFPESAQLDDRLLREAVALGESGKPEPYWLYPRPGPRTANAAVYTPFIRVALAAYAAAQRGERLSTGTLPDWVKDPAVHVVVRAQNSSGVHEMFFPDDPPLARTPITQIALVPHGKPPGSTFIEPKWLTRDLSYLDAIGGAPFPNAVAAAAFDARAMVQDVDVFGWWRKENHLFPSHGFLDPKEFTNWR